MSQMHYFKNKFLKIAKRWGLPAPLTFDFSDLKLRDLSKLRFFKLIMSKSNFKNKQLWSHHNTYGNRKTSPK